MAATLDDVVKAIQALSKGAVGPGSNTPAEDPAKLEKRLQQLSREENLLYQKKKAIDATDTSLKGQIKTEEAQLSLFRKKEERYLAELKLLEQNSAQNRARIAEVRDALQAAENEVDLRSENIIALKKESEEIDKNTIERKKQKQVMDSVSDSMSNQIALYGKHQLVNTGMIKSFVQMAKEGTLASAAMGAVQGIIMGLIDTTINFAFAVDEARSSLMKTTGVSREFATSITSDAQAMAYYGVSIDDMTGTVETLIPTFTEFTRLSVEQQKAVRETGDLLAKAGVGTKDYAQSIQTLTKTMGLGVEGSAAMAREFTSLAMAIGVTPEQLTSDFANLGGQLTKLGTDAPAAFKQLAIASKNTGLSIEKMLNITDKFDTFEGAATQAGMLNAALGGNFVNAMDLMMETDPVGRLNMIRDAILSTGLSFDDMGYYQRQFYAEAAGLENVNDLALLMSGSLDALSESGQKTTAEIEALRERTKAMQSIQEKFKTLFMSMIPVLEDLIDPFQELLSNPAEMEQLTADLTTVFKGFASAALFVAENLGFMAKALGVFVAGSFLAKLTLFGLRLKGIGTAAPVVGNSMKGMVGPAIAFGAAILLIGQGIKLATEGFASFAEAFALLPPESVTAFNEAIGGLLYTLMAFAVGVGVASTAGATAVGPMLAFGGALALIGLAIAAPAAAIGYMAGEFAELMNSVSEDKLDSIATFLGKMAIAGPAATLAAASLGTLAGGISLVASALNDLPVETMQLLNNLGGADVPAGTPITRETEAIMSAIDRVSTNKMAAAAVVVAATTPAATPAMATAGAPTGGNNASPVDVNVKVFVDGVVTKAVSEVDKRLRDGSLGL